MPVLEIAITAAVLGWIVPIGFVFVFCSNRRISEEYVLCPVFFGVFGVVIAILWYQSRLLEFHVRETTKKDPHSGRSTKEFL